jgi:formate dehydrogenase gamma subunit
MEALTRTRRSNSLRTPLIVFATLLLATCPSLGAAAEDSLCYECHADRDLTKFEEGKEISLYVDQTAFENSVHGDLGCTGCHVDVEDMEDEHAAELERVNCGMCHEETDEIYEESVHAQAIRAGVTDSARCSDCHGTHYILPKENPGSFIYPMNVEKTCDRCHGDVAFVEEHVGIPDKVLPGLIYKNSVHGRAVEAGIEGAATCSDCHSGHNLRSLLDPKSLISRQNVASTCGKCHHKAYDEYFESVHGVAAAQGVSDSPTCTDCHGIHSIRAAIDPESSVAEQKISLTTCPQCHGAERLTREYGLSTLKVKSYLDSYHGLAKRGGDVVAANCASCHGVHDIRPSGDPKSMIYKDNLVATCGKCHPGASDNFAQFPVHFTPTIERGSPLGDLIASYVRVFYLILIALTVIFMYFHGGVDFMKKWLASRKRAGGKYYLRLTVNERIQHAVLALSFIVLVITGFALRYPDAWWVGIFFGDEPGSPMRGLLHRIAGIVCVVAGIYHILYVLFTRRGHDQLKHLVPRPQDAKDMISLMKFDLGLAKEAPKFGRYSYIEKIEYFGAIWGTAVMTVTGFVLWYNQFFSLLLPSWGVNVARVIHFYEAILASMTILVWHLYSVMFDPEVYPMNWAKVTGYIPEDQMKHHHSLEWEEIEGVAVTEDRPGSEEENRLLEQAEQSRKTARERVEGPWKLTSEVKPYSSTRFKTEEAKKILKKK